MRRVICGLVVAMTLAGCATKYGEMGFTGGVAAQQVTADTYRIVARGNGYTQAATVQDHTMLKAAETAKMAGHTHFAMVGTDNQSSTLTHVSGGRFFATASTTVKPGTDTLIKVLTLPAGSVVPAGTFSADEIIAIIGSRVERPDDHERKPKRPG